MSKKHLDIVVVSGVRPQFVKCAALQKGIAEFNKDAECSIRPTYINTGQHYDDEMAGVFIRELDIHFDLTITHDDKRPAQMLGKMIAEIGDYIAQKEPKPQWVIVMGDANPALVGTIAAIHNLIPIAHFEAGTALDEVVTREVLNGKIITSVSEVYLCASSSAVERLRSIGKEQHVFNVGDMTRDFIIDYSKGLPEDFLGYSAGSYVLLTMHHHENLSANNILTDMISALCTLEFPVLFVVHPRTRKILDSGGIDENSNIRFLSPLSYRQMLTAIKNAAFIVTDSGGLQREAYYLKKRCLVRQDVEFWPDLTQNDVHKLIGRGKNEIEIGVNWVKTKLNAEEYPTIDDLEVSGAIENSMKVLVALSELS